MLHAQAIRHAAREGISQRDIFESEVGSIDHPKIRHGEVVGFTVSGYSWIAHILVFFLCVIDAPIFSIQDFWDMTPVLHDRLYHQTCQSRILPANTLHHNPQIEIAVAQADVASIQIPWHTAT